MVGLDVGWGSEADHHQPDALARESGRKEDPGFGNIQGTRLHVLHVEQEDWLTSMLGYDIVPENRRPLIERRREWRHSYQVSSLHP